MTAVELHSSNPGLAEVMDYARAVSSASMLPDNYRNKPADIMLAVGLGQSMGLSPAESLYRISVIKGKPTASAELVAANVRKAGHRLRVQIEPGKATATIVRADDPDFEFTVVRDAAWAQAMGLADQTNYRKQGDTMLSWRAITAAARLACPEALYGVQYTPDEIDWNDERPARTDQQPASGAERMTAVLGGPNLATADDVIEGRATYADTRGGHMDRDTFDREAAEREPEGITSSQLKKIGAAMRDLGITERADALLYVNDVIGREVNSRNELTKDEASRVIDSLERDLIPAEDAQ